MTSGKVPAKAFAVFAVALMLIVSIVPLLSVEKEVNAADTGEFSVTYHSNNGKDAEKTVYYHGIGSAEYNPEINWKWIGNTYTKDMTFRGTLVIDFNKSVDKEFVIPQGVVFDTSNATFTHNKTNTNILEDDFSFETNERVLEGGSTQKILTIHVPRYIGWDIRPHDDISGQIKIPFTYTVKSATVQTVFAGWTTSPQNYDTTKDSDGNAINIIDPGDILDKETSNLYALWYTPNLYWGFEVLDLNNDELLDFSGVLNYLPFDNGNIRYGVEDKLETGYGVIQSQHENAYTSIYKINGTVETGDYLPQGTYRSETGNQSVIEIKETWDGGPDYHIPLTGDVIIDNIILKTGASTSNHGSDSDHGLFADGHKLIIGTNVTTVTTNSDDSKNPMGYPQIFGGRASDVVNNHTSAVGETPPSSTDVVIFSGTYYNVVAGNYDVNMSGDTHLVIRGKTTVLDTVVGGNSAKKEGITVSNTWIYILGGCLPADSYQEDQLGTSGNTNGVTLTESTILTGGCNNGRVTGSTNVFISGDADLWDVQGAGRRGMSYVGTANVEVSGQAVIRHVLCGSITDGLDGVNGTPSNMSEYDGSVKNVNITVKDAAAVGSVFGAGYDTYYNTLYASMFNGGSISIDIQGGTVGYVYGGGYRGAIGYSGELSGTSYGSLPLNSISISISGGTVLGDVFGGGRGGVDKVIHSNDDGDLGEGGAGSPGKNDSTGFAWVSVRDLSITVSGDAVVEGSVYGGGESAPGLTDYIKRPAVAFMDADSISLEVSESAQVLGSVFGAGKGVDTSTYTTDTMVLKSNNSTMMDRVPWHSGSDVIDDGYDDDTSYNVAGYAAVGQGRNTPNDRPDIFLSIIGEAKVGNGHSAVFGAGRLAYTYADSIEIHLGNGGPTGPELKGDVFGGGLGTSGEFSVESSRTIVLNSATVNGNIYGGSRDGNDGNVSSEVSQISKTAEINLISGTVKQNVFGGGFQGKSMYDAVVRFGTSAVDEVRPTSVQNTDLRVTSIYGGGYFDPDSGAEVQDLVMGDATIYIGSSALSGAYSFPGYANIGDAGSGSRISISGNVFGDGSYSTVKGTTTVEFNGYTQTSGTASQRMMSVQLVDVLRFISSEVDLSGSSQGGTGTLSQKMSINSVGLLNLHASSSIRLYAETSAIGGLNSYESEDESNLFLPEGYDWEGPLEPSLEPTTWGRTRNPRASSTGSQNWTTAATSTTEPSS